MTKNQQDGDNGKLCIECGSNNKTINFKRRGKYYCWRHYQQMVKYGNILEKTIKDTNDYVFNGDGTIDIVLRNREREVVAHCTIDSEDFDAISVHTWNLNSTGYVTSSVQIPKRKTILIHRVITHAEEGLLVDHKDRNPLNNRKSNLRMATKSQNAMNSEKPSDNTSGVKGVSFDKSMDKWQAYIKIDYKKIHLGYFIYLEDATNARKAAEEKYQGDFRLRGEYGQ